MLSGYYSMGALELRVLAILQWYGIITGCDKWIHRNPDAWALPGLKTDKTYTSLLGNSRVIYAIFRLKTRFHWNQSNELARNDKMLVI